MEKIIRLACVLAILVSIHAGLCTEDACHDVTFRKSSLYSSMKPVESPTRALTFVNKMGCARTCSNDVTCKGFLFSSDVGLCSLYSTPFYSLSFVTHTGTDAYEPITGDQADCYEAMMNGGSTSGVYVVVPRDNGAPINVFCEMGSTNGGWLVIQRRTDGSQDFYKTWNEYKDGFGNLNNEFWLGNTAIHRLTSRGQFDLRIDMEDFEGDSAYALYKNFSLGSEENYFQLRVGEYSGDSGDALSGYSGFNFTTKDQDNDPNSNNCAVVFKGAWWYKACHSSNLNGQYLEGNHSTYADGVNWQPWRGYYYSLKTTVMKIRPSI